MGDITIIGEGSDFFIFEFDGNDGLSLISFVQVDQTNFHNHLSV
jgi:hypothetical protein